MFARQRGFSLASLFFVASASLLSSRVLFAAEPAPAVPPMDYGSFLAYGVSEPPVKVAKGKKPPERVGIADTGLSVDVGNGLTFCFDEDTCRMAAGWNGTLLDLSRTHQTSLKGSWDASPAGLILFSTKEGPGCARGDSFADPRPMHVGPLPKERAHYKGLYRHGKQTILSYTLGGADVLELPGSATAEGLTAFTRTIRVSTSSAPSKLYVCDATGAEITQTMLGRTDRPGVRAAFVLSRKSSIRMIVGDLLPDGAALAEGPDSRIELHLPALASPVTFRIVLIDVRGQPDDKVQTKLLASLAPPEDLPALCHGGPSQWPAIVTEGRLALAANKPYVVDTLSLPDGNPWHSWMRPTGLDFFPDGRCAVCTMNGDVWIVSGIDEKLEHLSWKRFATGLYEPLGLKIVDGTIYVLCRDQITRLHDLDGDGEADFYENFNNDVPAWPAYNTFHLDLQTDSQKNFWFTTSGLGVPTAVPMQASVIKVSSDGSKAEVIAGGLRAANGAGMGPHDEFVCSDNQGNWTPVCRINLVKPGGFYGFNYTPGSATPEDMGKAHTSYDPPLCWVPYEKDNSTGGQEFITGNKWGPLDGLMLSTSYGKCRLFEVMWEQSEGITQGGSVELPLDFASGIMRARFNPADGQLYVCGMKGWQTSASRDGCLQRVRYTGKQVCLPRNLSIKKDGIEIAFTCPLDPKTAADEQSYAVEQYNYKWSSKYGSGKYKASDGKVGTDDVDVKSARLLPDGKTVFLAIPNLRPVMQMSIQIHISAADGAPIECTIDNTINHVPGSPLPPVLTSP
jgi:hypothetical protein